LDFVLNSKGLKVEFYEIGSVFFDSKHKKKGNYLAKAACEAILATLFALLTRRQKDFNGCTFFFALWRKKEGASEKSH
jgi:hypothetical protein